MKRFLLLMVVAIVMQKILTAILNAFEAEYAARAAVQLTIGGALGWYWNPLMDRLGWMTGKKSPPQ